MIEEQKQGKNQEQNERDVCKSNRNSELEMGM